MESRLHIAPESAAESARADLSADALVYWLRRLARWIVGAGVAGLALGLLISVFVPNTYESVGKLIVRWGRREQATTDAVDDPSRAASTGRADDVLTEIHLLNNPIVYERVARRPGLARLILAPYDPTTFDDAKTAAPTRWFHGLQKWCFGATPAADGCCTDASCPRCVETAAKLLEKRTTIAPQAGTTSVVSVSHLAGDPRAAKTLVDALLEEIQTRHQEVFATDSEVEFLRTQMQAANTLRDHAAIRLADTRRTCGVYDLKAQRTELLHGIHEIEDKQKESEAELKSLDAQIELYTNWLRNEPELKTAEVAPQVANPLYTVRLQLLETLRAEHDQLLEHSNPGARKVKEKEAQIAEAEEALADTPLLIPGSFDGQQSVNSAHERMVVASQELKAKREGLVVASSELARHRAELEDSLQRLAECEPDVKKQEEDLATKEQTAQRFTDAFNRWSMNKSLDLAGMTNLRCIQNGTVPEEAFAPNRRSYLALGLLAGLALGVAAALVRGLCDRSLRTARDVERLLGRRVLGLLPDLDPGTGRRAAS